MAEYTQSGYPVIFDYGNAQLVDNPVIPGTGAVKALGGLRAGAPATVLKYVLARFHTEVEPLRQELGVWGFEPREIAGGDGTWSNHAGGVAVDANAAQHPQYQRGTFDSGQVRAIRRIIGDLDGIADWGGEWDDGSVDEMHVQLHGDIAGTGKVEQAAAAIAAGDLPNVPAALLSSHSVAHRTMHTDPHHDPSAVPPFPLPRGFYYGPFEGPAESISGSGHTDTEQMRQGLKKWQSRMKERGSVILPDGYYGAQTAAVARTLQRSRHLLVDALIGPTTWRAAWS